MDTTGVNKDYSPRDKHNFRAALIIRVKFIFELFDKKVKPEVRFIEFQKKVPGAKSRKILLVFCKN